MLSNEQVLTNIVGLTQSAVFLRDRIDSLYQTNTSSLFESIRRGNCYINIAHFEDICQATNLGIEQLTSQLQARLEEIIYVSIPEASKARQANSEGSIQLPNQESGEGGS